MPKERKKECPNCKGTNKKCHYLTDAKICTKGKAISKATEEKRERYDVLLGNRHTDYLNKMRNNQIKEQIDKETGEILTIDGLGKVTSFERYLSLIGEKNLASFLRRNYKDRLKEFNFKDQ